MSQRSRILVAEDTCTIRAVVEKTLSHHGFSVATAVDGQEAWELAQQERFELIVTDEQMPRMSGRALCRQLRADPYYARIPIIFLTGKAFDIDVRGLNAVAVISKPFSPLQLADAVRLALGNDLPAVPC